MWEHISKACTAFNNLLRMEIRLSVCMCMSKRLPLQLTSGSRVTDGCMQLSERIKLDVQ
jgi:hypothetical protein